jgi:hypothetical protein
VLAYSSERDRPFQPKLITGTRRRAPRPLPLSLGAPAPGRIVS